MFQFKALNSRWEDLLFLVYRQTTVTGRWLVEKTGDQGNIELSS